MFKSAQTPKVVRLLACSALLLGVALPLAFAQTKGGTSQVISGLAKQPATTVAAPAQDLPPSMQEKVKVMVEMTEAPAAIMQAEELKVARLEADQEFANAQAHPNSPGAQAILKNPRKVELSATAAARIESRVQTLKQQQDALLSSLTSAPISAQVVFRVQRAYNGIAVSVNADRISEIAKLPGVKAIHAMHPKHPSTAFSDIDFLRARTVPGGPWSTAGVHGEGIKVADIDSGLDYVHANFGGNGDYTGVTDTDPNGHFPSAKVPGGIDLVGDAYDANDPNSVPMPDHNPFDCGGHGTGTASLIAGFGENNDGSTYTGPYDATHPDISSLRIAPGLAPKALLYPVRVFGCSGSTNVVVEAIDWAIAHHMDVINMSLGANEGYADDPDAIAATNAAAAGILVCSAAGNAGDTYYIHSSPAAAGGTLSVAASYNDQAGFISDSSVTGNAPPPLAGQKFPSIYGTDSPHTGPSGLTGNVVYGVPNNAITPFTNASDINGKICLVDRGAVTFVDMITKAFNAGAIAVIVDNFNHPGEDPILMSTPGQPPIPAVMITKENRDTIVAAAGGFDPTTGEPANTVNVTIADDSAVVTHGGAAPDTIPSYSSRGPRLPDSAVKPDLTAPAEVVGVASFGSGDGVSNFNGTSSATPHVSGMMALLRQLHPTWSVQELNALACDTATHDLFTTIDKTVQYGVGRIGAGRIDLTNAATANVVAYNGSDAGLIGLSFGVVETPAHGTMSVTKNVTVTNKGATTANYTLSIQNNPAVAGANFSFPNGNSLSVPGGASVTVPVTFTAKGRLLKHAREASVTDTQATIYGTFPRQWLTEAAGYAVFAPQDGSPTLRVSVYAAAKPVSAMHSDGPKDKVTGGDGTGSFRLKLAGTPVNTGPNYGDGFDIISLVKPLELQYARRSRLTAPVNPNILKYVGVTSDYSVIDNKADTTITFGMEGLGDAAVPEYNSSDKEIYFDVNNDGNFDFATYLSSLPVGTAHSNVYYPYLVNLLTGTVSIPGYVTNILSPDIADTNSFNNSAILLPLPAASLGDPDNGLPAPGSEGGPTAFNYLVVTFDRNGNEVDETPVLTYDLANPGFDLEAGNLEPFYYIDVPSSIPVQFSKKNFRNNHSLGVWLVHMHNGDGNRSDVIPFERTKPQ